METRDPKNGRRKVLEAIGCSLYIIAFIVMGAVLVSQCDTVFK